MTVLDTPSVEGRVGRGALSPRCTLVGAPDAPVVVVLGGISATRHVVSSADQPGWWGDVAGDGCAIDTSRFRVLVSDLFSRQEIAP